MALFTARRATLVGLALLGGLAWTAKPAPAEAQIVIDVEAAPPPRIETYPHTYYQDRDVYWARGRWYYRRAGHWYYYHDEPPPLRQHRVRSFERHPHARVHEVYREPRRERYHRHVHRHERRDERGRVLVVR